MAQPSPARRRTVVALRIVSLVLVIVPVGCLLTPSAAAVEYFVGVDHPNASDSNDGLSPDHPFRTLGRGTLGLLAGDTLSIMAGVYREILVIHSSGTAADPIVIRAYPGDEERVVVRGSDRVIGWTTDGGSVWSVPWVPLPLITYPAGWPDYGEYSRRREMVFVDGEPLRQVLTQGELGSGNFWMDGTAGRIRINHQGDPNSLQVEISIRTQGVNSGGKSYCIFRGLRVEHVTTELLHGAMHLGTHHRVEDCRVEHNNGQGIVVYSDSVLLRSTSNNNGRLGVGLNGDDSLMDSCETSYNSWRYGPMWEAGGIKVVGDTPPTGNRVVRHTAKYNNGPGVWFDTVGSGNVVEASLLEANVLAGVDFEAADGPNWINNNVIVETFKTVENYWAVDGSGILLYEALDTNIYNNTIVGVSGSGLVIFGGERGPYYCARTAVFNNIIVNSGEYAIHVGVAGRSREAANVASHHFDNNLYHGNPILIVFPDISTPYNLFQWSLPEWQQNRREDLNSFDVDPGFVRPPVGDYSLLTDSLAIDAGCDLSDVLDDITGRPRPQDSGHDIGAFECPLGGGCGLIIRFDFESGQFPN